VKPQRGNFKSSEEPLETRKDLTDADNYALEDALDMTSGNEFEHNYGSPFTLSNHDLSGIKNGSGKYPCDECEYQADGQVILKRHKQAKHEGAKLD
jgi:hypothetical protein